MTTGLASWVRCFHCNAEQSVIGPTVAPTFEYPGWMVDMAAFYTPGGHHLCPLHQRQGWLAYCANFLECEFCTMSNGIFIDAPLEMGADEVLTHLNDEQVPCDGGFTLVGLELADVHSTAVVHRL